MSNACDEASNPDSAVHKASLGRLKLVGEWMDISLNGSEC